MPKRRIGEEPEAYDVFLDEASPKELKTLHCAACGFVICQYYHRLRIIAASTAISPKNQGVGIIEGENVTAPIVLQCHNSNCRVRANVRIVIK